MTFFLPPSEESSDLPARNLSPKMIGTAMVLAAGLGMRMRPLTDHLPKPLVALAGRPLIDHVLDRLAAAGVRRAVVNVHYCAEALEAHLAARAARGVGPSLALSDERGLLLDTGGGVRKALDLLGKEPFFAHNSDSVWIEEDGAPEQGATLARMIAAWDAGRMDALLLVAPRSGCLGYDGRGDFDIDEDGRLSRRRRDGTAGCVFAGVSILTPRLFAGAPDGPFSLNVLFDQAIAAGRLFGVIHRGLWMHVGTPEALDAAAARITRLID